ncbi:MAG: hypothetical protein K2O13_08000 [Lachnospiraceae bacterium]|nr:hypothetical protein [Lachnospiraceae bacterium]
MALTPVRNLQLHNQIERVLHVQGNYRGGILEMAIVVDREFDRETIRELCADIIISCKKQSEVFRNVRLNMVVWGANEIRTETVASAYVQMGTFFESYEREIADGYEKEQAGEEHGDGESVIRIMEYLKKFHARSKLILLLTPDRAKMYQVSDPDRLRRALSPFLKQKLILLYPEEMEPGTRLFMQ